MVSLKDDFFGTETGQILQLSWNFLRLSVTCEATCTFNFHLKVSDLLWEPVSKNFFCFLFLYEYMEISKTSLFS